MRRRLGLAIGVVAVAALAAAGVAAAADTPPDPWAMVPAAAPVRSATGGIDVAEARRRALATIPGGRILQIESDFLIGREAWKVYVDGPDGRVVVFVEVLTGAITVRSAEAVPPAATPSGPDDDATESDDDSIDDEADRKESGDDRSGTRGDDSRHGGDGRGRGRGRHDDGPGHR